MSKLSSRSNKLLREELRKRRRDIPSRLRLAHDRAIQMHLLQLIRSQRVGSLACFWPFDGEPDLIPICKELIADDCKIALPVVSKQLDYKMEFHRWDAVSPLTKNRYGIREPQKTMPMPLSGFDMLLLPLVGYDKTGNRLGMGAGYYDRQLETLRDLHRPYRLGIAYSLQQVSLIRKNDWDVPLHGLVNEQGLIPFR